MDNSYILDSMLKEKFLEHYGMPRRSGRYPYGSGDNPYQRTMDFLGRVETLRSQGLSERDIMASLKMSPKQYRDSIAIAKSDRRALEAERAMNLREKGYSLVKIAETMGYKNDSSIRTLLDEATYERNLQARNTADFLKAQVDEKGMIDVGKAVELGSSLNISRTKMDQALALLQMEGYNVYGGRVPQVTNPNSNQATTLMVLCKPGIEHKEIFNFENIKQIEDYTSDDNGKTFRKVEYPASLDPKRLAINYKETGGDNLDGVIMLRRGVSDISLDNSNYSQVRILVGKDRYLKGMAVYGNDEDFPDGVDVIFNTNKSNTVGLRDVLKETKPGDNPFGAYISPDGQSYIPGTNKLRVINKTRDEGEWGEWSKSLPSQFLAKQNKDLIDRQLKLTVADKKAEYDEIMSVTNPTLRRRLLKDFSDGLDSAAVDLAASSLPGQKYQVILPVPSLKDTEVYAPNYKNGQELALVRFPHGGTYEIPIVTVNNKNKEGIDRLTRNAADGIGVNYKTAQKLSGADFDGDTVMVIPITSKTVISNNKGKSLPGLEGFDPSSAYPERKGMKYMTKDGTGMQMGMISNLLTDMTLKGANEAELARATRHSMVVIDAAKHKLDYTKSARDNDIAELKAKYQEGGASTILSRAKSPQYIPQQREVAPNPATGERQYKVSTKTFKGKDGIERGRTQKTSKMMLTDDAFTLVSDNAGAKEKLYATFANTMKAMANSARKDMMAIKDIDYSPSAAKTYAAEKSSLDSKLTVALKNKPKERQANMLAKSRVDAQIEANPVLKDDKKTLKKLNQSALDKARAELGAKKEKIEVSDKEWEAIQNGAITKSKLNSILDNANMDTIKSHAMPKQTSTVSTAQQNRVKAMVNSGYTNTEIAEALGISTSTVSNIINK